MRAASKLTKAAAAVAGGLSLGLLILAIDDGGPAQTREVALGQIEGVSISHGLSAQITIGPETRLTMTGRARDLEGVLTGVTNGTFSAWREGNLLTMARRLVDRVLGREIPVVLAMSLPTLTEIDVGLGSVVTVTELEALSLDVTVDTGGMVSLKGAVQELVLEVTNGGSIDASAINVARAKLDASSGGSIRITATQSVRASGSSGAAIVVLGAPKHRDVDISTGATVVFDEQKRAPRGALLIVVMPDLTWTWSCRSPPADQPRCLQQPQPLA